MINKHTICYPFSSSDIKTKVEYDANQNELYIGQAAPGSATDASCWQIRKMTYDANQNVTQVDFAEGKNDYAYAWDSRAGYSYS